MTLPKRIIISRKGFDSTAGGFASPILDGKLISLPIPECKPKAKKGNCAHITYADLGNPEENVTFAQLFLGLGSPEITTENCVHLDPDIRPDLRSRHVHEAAKKTFCFGQDDKSQTELSAVSNGDLFLFFGWFREVERIDQTFRYKRGSQDKHVLWGWLEVGKKIRLTEELAYCKNDGRYRHHPHVSHNPEARPNNVLYEASTQLSFDPHLAGSGTFKNYCDELSFTKIGNYSRSTWRLPAFFRQIQLSRFKFQQWVADEDGFIIPPKRCKGCGAASYGQEFVFSTEGPYEREIEAWLKKKFTNA